MEYANGHRQNASPDPERNLFVEAALLHRIIDQGPIPFSEFMDICLYSPGGYYSGGRVAMDRYGMPADFITSPEAHPAFGATMANVLHDMWESMQRPKRFDVVEMGAGNGTLARTILEKMAETYPDLRESATYTIVEQSPALIERQKSLLGGEVQIVESSAIAVPLKGVRGVMLSNELLDAFPVSRLKGRNGTVSEVYIGLDDEANFVEVEGEVSTAANDPSYIEKAANGEYAVSPQLYTWQQSIARALEAGYVITVDYGLSAQGADYPPVRAYSSLAQTATLDIAYKLPGVVDITASIDFDLLAGYGERCGLATVTRARQRDFLLDNGFELELARSVDAYRRIGIEPQTHYFSSYGLLDAEGMGGYEVLVQQKVENITNII